MATGLTPRQQRMEAAGAWLAKAGGTAAPGELSAAVGLSNRHRQAEVLADLTTAGLITRPGGRVHLSPDGWAHFAGIGPGMAGEVLDRVLAGWPARHRAFQELLAGSTIARLHLAEAYPRHEHLGFMAIGETGTGKTAIADLHCHLFGFDRVEVSVFTPAETTGSLLGRRDRSGNDWTWEPAPMTFLPFVFLDEFDKADGPVQRVAWSYFRGSVAVQAEGQRHQLRPTPMLGANPPARGERLGALRSEYRRRSVVLDTGGTSRTDLEEYLTAFYAGPQAADRLSLRSLVPPAALDPSALEVLKQLPALKGGDAVLTEAGLAEFPGVRALELATLGRLALLGPGADHALAAAATMTDYLTVTESVPGQVHEGWQARLAASVVAIAGGEPLMAALERSSKARAEAHAEVSTSRRRREHVSEAILQGGAELAEQCRLARAALAGTKVPEAHKPAAAGLRKRLAHHQDSAAKVSTDAGLDDVGALAAPALEEASALLATIHAARDQVETARRAAVADRQRERAARKEWARGEAQRRRAYRAQQTAGLKRVRAKVKELEALHRRVTTKPGESPLEVLRDLYLVEFQQGPVPVPQSGWRGKILPQTRTGWWVIAGSGTTLHGSQLRSWGPGTRAALEPALAYLRAQEATLVQELDNAKRMRPIASRPQRAIGGRR